MGKAKIKEYRADDDGFFGLTAPRAAGLVTLVGALLCMLGYSDDPNRFGYSYLFGFFVVASLVLGGIFYSIALHFTTGYWGITARRMAEVAGSGAIVLFALAIPLGVGVATDNFNMYDEWMNIHAHGHGHGGHDDHADEHEDHDDTHGEEDADEAEEHGSLNLFGPSTAHAQDPYRDPRQERDMNNLLPHTPQMEAAHHHVLEHKSGWLSPNVWYGRGFVYLLLWIFIGFFFLRNSLRQDRASEKEQIELARKMKKHSAWMAIVFGLSLTFAAFDWLMSLEPSWYSTIFGVQVFAGCAIGILSVMVIVGISLHQRGLVGQALNVEHIHDHGRLLFGFMCFWAYVSFSQWMLIYYAGIPEEAVWYHRRWGYGWKFFSLAVGFGHFVLPFYFLISRLQKRNFAIMKFGAIWLLTAHVMDVYWLVLPQAGAFNLGPSDVGGLLFCGGAFFTYFFMTLKKHPLVPMGDPRLHRTLAHHQIY